jgi:hypothetical protein
LVSAQNRQRFYVTNWGDIQQPADRGILLKDILETGDIDGEKSYCLKHQAGNARDHFKKHHTNIAFEPVCEPVRIGDIGSTAQAHRVYSAEGKTVTINSGGGGQGGKTGLYATPIIDRLGGLYNQDTRWGIWNTEAHSPTLTAAMGQGGGHVPMVSNETDDTTISEKNPTDKKQVYEVRNGQITIKGKQYPIKLADGFYVIRKLTPIECERLQTLTNTEKSVIIDLQNNITEVSRCLENLFIPVQCAEEKCRRLQSYVYSAQREQDQQETVLFAERYMSISLLQTDGLVQLNVHINLEDWSNQKDFLKESLKLARTAGKNTNYHGVGKIESFVQAVVGICMLPEQTMQAGKVGLPKNGSHFAQQENGNLRCMMFGIEITQPAKNAEKNIKMETELLKYITSDHLSTKLTEQKLKTLYCYAINVIAGYIQEKTSGKSLSKIKFNTVQGYTHGVAACNRYRGLGNGWTSEVIIHLLQHAKIPLDDEITVVSMYDGIGTGRYCLDKMGYKNVKYYAYEIDKYAIQIAKSNYPDIVELGDAFQVRQENWEVIK